MTTVNINGCCIKETIKHPCSRRDIPEDVSLNYLIVHSDGMAERTDDFTEPGEGEGSICYSQGLYVDSLEIGLDFLKSDTAEAWLEYIMVRQIKRLHYIDPQFFIYTERG